MKDTQSYMAALPAPTLRDLIDKVNKAGIKKDDIVYICKENETFIVLHYVTPEK